MRWHFFIILGVTILALIGAGLLMFGFDPIQASQNVKYLFLASVFIALWGIMTLLFYILATFHAKLIKDPISGKFFSRDYRKFYNAFRRGLLLAVAVILMVIVNRVWTLNMTLFLIIVGVAVAIETAFIIFYRNKDRIDDIS